MEEQNVAPNPRRVRKPNPMKVFKEQYLPYIILVAAGLMILIFVIGAKLSEPKDLPDPSDDGRIDELMAQEVDHLKEQAAKLAQMYDHEGALALLAGYTGGMNTEQSLVDLYKQYQAELDQMVIWNDLAQVPGLSFRTLVADLEKAKADPDRGSRYQKSYVTVEQFSAILQQLYDNGYVLVSLYDFAVPSTDAEGVVTLAPASIKLPAGKKPILLTQEGVNYYDHTQASGGFATCLTLDAGGEITCAMKADDGSTVLGNFDFVPILNAFLAEHPDFSYRGSKATLALSGFDGLLGYDLTEEKSIKEVLKKLRKDGYDIACYTYADMRYGDYGVVGIQEDLDLWTENILPLFGKTDILVYPTGGDVKGQEPYSGSKYEALQAFGFRYYSGTGEGIQWGMTTLDYARHIRTVVTPDNMKNHPEYFTGLFDSAVVLGGGTEA